MVARLERPNVLARPQRRCRLGRCFAEAPGHRIACRLARWFGTKHVLTEIATHFSRNCLPKRLVGLRFEMDPIKLA